MVRTGIAVAVCLLVVAGSLAVPAVGTTSARGLDDCNPETATSPVAADGPVLAVVPAESTVGPDEHGVVLVCVVNPPGNDEAFDFSLVVEHDRDPEDAPLVLVGPEVGPNGTSTQQVVPLDRRIGSGYGRFVAPGSLPPGTGAQYAIVVPASAPRGDYEFDVAVEWDPIRVEEEAVLHVAGSRCRLFCGVGQSIDGAVAVLAAGAAYLRTHPSALLAFLGVLVGVASATIALLNSAWWRSRLLGSEDADDESRGR